MSHHTNSVRVSNVSHVSLPPSSPSIPNRIKLSPLDTPWVSLPPIQRLLLFSDVENLPPFTTIVESLKSSLSLSLARYFPLAGKLLYLHDSREVVIDCSDESLCPGVEFIEAECNEDIRRLSSAVDHDVVLFGELVPKLCADELPAPTFAVQLTKFSDGLSVGFSVHHTVVDGKALWKFIEDWTARCRGVHVDEIFSPPVIDRAVIVHPKAEEIALKNLHYLSRNLPKINWPFLGLNEEEKKVSRRTFVISPQSIQNLKQRASSVAPSTYVALCANAWTAFIQANNFNMDEDVFLIMLGDCRARIRPPVDDAFFGNCIKGFYAKTRAEDIIEHENGYENACKLIKKAIRESLESDPLKDLEHWMDLFQEVSFAKAVNVASSPRFMVYDTDFGFGRPSRVELVSTNHDGEMVFAGARDGVSVQLSVSLNEKSMEIFDKCFVQGLVQ